VNRQGFIDAIVATADRVEAGSAVGAVPGDPGDDMVVAAALAGRVDFLLTFDRHLLDLAGLPSIVVLRPGDFLRELRAQH
jgi:predicted nucleic acid-binding protein